MTAATAATGDPTLANHLALWDWRRQVADLYAAIRDHERSRLAWDLWRQTRNELFRDHPQSPLDERDRAGFRRLPMFDYDPAFRLVVDLVPAQSGERLSIAAGRDGAVSLQAFAHTRGLETRLGGELTLYWIGGYGGGVFLPFRDATSGRDSFGGGRYVLDTIKGADLGRTGDGRTVLDFNFAYNPSCAYSDQWVCPLSPPANELPRPVRAGERFPA